MDRIKSIITERKNNYPELLSHPNFEKRLRWELIEIEVQDEEEYFVNLFNTGKKHQNNDNNLLIPVILGIVDQVNLDEEPCHKMGDFPDVDVDYLPVVRDYLKNEWAPKIFGDHNVCSIGNYGTFGLKSSLIDMTRVHGLDRNEILKITTNMGLKDDDGQALTLDKALELYPELKAYCDNHPEIEIAVRKLLNRNRSMGKHAGGLIICNNRIDNFVPLVRGTDGNPVSAWVEGLHGQDLGPVGLIKFDLLVVDGLYQIAMATKLVKERHNILNLCALEGDWDWSDTAYLNDPKSLEMANNGDMRCIFQFDSDGIRNLVMKGGVSQFEDLVAYVSIYRPSTLQVKMDEEYVQRKRGQKKYEIPDILKSVLSSSYGILIYQEHIMMILNIVGKIPLRDCYQVIKAISKKKLSAFIKYKDKFIENGQKTLGWNQKQMEEYWQLIEAFSGYGFNKSVTEDTIIYCVDGSKQIKDIRAGDKVYCVNEKGEQAQTEVVAVHDHGVIDVVEVTFDDGYSVKCTLDHKFLTEEGQVPLWRIIRDNLFVLSSPLGEKNDKTNTLGDCLRSESYKQERILQACERMSNLQKRSAGKETIEKISLWNSFCNKKGSWGTHKGLPKLFGNEVEAYRQAVCVPMWIEFFKGKRVEGTSRQLREMYGNKKEEHSGSHGKVERIQSCARNKGNIFCDSQEDFGKKGCTGVKSSATEEMEGQQSRRICKKYFESYKGYQDFQSGNLVKIIFKLGKQICSLWEKIQKICGFSKRKDMDRSGWSFSFLESQKQERRWLSQIRLHSSQRPNAEGGMFEKGKCDFIEAQYVMFSQQNRRNEEGVAGFTPEYAPITDTRRLVCRRVLRVVPVGKRQCYDLEVAVSTHNFILPNGVVTANSHATSYSFISARQLYLKSHYPIEFYTSSLICQDNDDKKREYITEAINHHVQVCELDINRSKETFSIVDDKIYIGFSNIKGIGVDKAVNIVKMQPYIGFVDFLDRYGTEANTIKPLVCLGVFRDADPLKLYKFWLLYTEYKKQLRDKEKRFEVTLQTMLNDLVEIVPPFMKKALESKTKITSEILKVALDFVETREIPSKDEVKKGILKLESKFNAACNRFAVNSAKLVKPSLDNFDDTSVDIDDVKILPLLENREAAEVAFYGFIWSNRVRNSPKYQANYNFASVKSKQYSSPQVFYSVIGQITDVLRKNLKSGSGFFANVMLMDDNFEIQKVTFWQDDAERFQEELRVGNLISIQVVPASNGFPGYNFYGPPKHKRYILPKNKNLDYRLIVLEGG